MNYLAAYNIFHGWKAEVGRRHRYVFLMDRLPMSGPTVLVNGAWKQRKSPEWEPQSEPAA